MITQIKQVQSRVFQRLLLASGVEEFNGAQGRILYVLWQSGCVPIVELSKQTGLAKNTLTSMLSRMEESGLIRRSQSKTDRRSSVISLTEKSRGLEKKYNEVSQQMNELFYRGLTQADASRLDALLSRVLKNLEQTENELKK